MSGLGITQRQRTSSGAAFQLPSSSSSSFSSAQPHEPFNNNGHYDADSEDLDAPLPFPTALSRRDFLAPNFNAADYLSSLFPGDASFATDDHHQDNNGTTGVGGGGADALAGLRSHRHQTLEDLRTELRERSSAISAELLELVNANYTSFLGLGDELKGGEERVEDVRVALLGFRRQVEEIQSRVRGRREDVQRVGGELRGVRGEVETGRRMLELDERVEVLLGRLEEDRGEHDSDDDDEDEDEDEDGGDGNQEEVTFTGSSPSLLMDLAREYVAIDKLADAIGRDLPYVKKMEEGISRCRNTLLLDLGASMKEARKSGDKGRDRVMKLSAVHRLLGAYSEAVKILKEK